MEISYPSLIIAVSIFTISYLIYLYYQRAFTYWTKRFVPHLKPTFPFGNFNSKVLTDSGQILENIYNELKKSKAHYGAYYVLVMPFFMPLTPKLYTDMLITNCHCFDEHGVCYDEEKELLSGHLAPLSGSKWKYLRSKISTTFSSAKLNMMFIKLKECSNDMHNLIDKSEIMDIYNLASRYTTDAICSCAFGIEQNSLKNPNAEFLQYGRKFVKLSFLDSIRLTFGIMAPEILRKLKIRSLNPIFSVLFKKTVQETIEYREKNNIKINDLMGFFIRLKNNENIDDEDTKNITENNDAEGLTIDQIAAQVFLFYIAGFETSAMALTFCMYELARNPDIQQKVREEILNILQENNGEITYDAINNMHYTDKVLLETLRMYPPIVMINRTVTQRYRIPNNTLILEEGTRVVISTLGVHHDPAFYPQPDHFDPERFSEVEVAKRPPMTYFPFGDGPRICSGQKFAMIEIKLALTVLLKNYKYSVDPSTRTQIRTVTNGNMLGLKDKILLKLTKLN